MSRRPTAVEFVTFVRRSGGDAPAGKRPRTELRRVCRAAQKWLEREFPGCGLRASVETVDTGERAVCLVET